MKVLIIDDEEDTRSICGMSLGLIDGAQVVEASSGSDGLRLAAEERPDVIILDLLMPEMDGTETLRGLRKNPDTAEIPVIFLTTKGMFPEFDGLRSLGALAVICKPFDPVRIGSQIQEILEAAKSGEDEGDLESGPEHIKLVTDSATEPGAEAESETEAESKAEPEAEAETEAVPESESGTKLEKKLELKVSEEDSAKTAS